MSQELLNYYDYLCIPSKDIREQSRNMFFNTKNLKINTSKLEGSMQNITLDCFDDELFEKEFNSDVREIIRCFNNSILPLSDSLLFMYNYKKLLEKESDKEVKVYREIIYRKSVRNVCIELCIYEEKIKNIVRDLYKLDYEKTKNIKDLFNQLNSISNSNTSLKDFISACNIMINKQAYKDIHKIRNDEVHNRSIFDRYTFVMETQVGTASTLAHYKVSTNSLYTTVKNFLYEISEVAHKLQIIIDNFIDEN